MSNIKIYIIEVLFEVVIWAELTKDNVEWVNLLLDFYNYALCSDV